MIKGKKRFYQFKVYLHWGALLIQFFSKASVLQIQFFSKLYKVLVNQLSLLSLCSERPSLTELSSCAAEHGWVPVWRKREYSMFKLGKRLLGSVPETDREF